MITLISGTDRIDSNTFKLTKYIQSLYQDLGQETQIIDLAKVKSDMLSGPYYGGKNQPAELQTWTQMILDSDGLVVVVPEYNGSYPGILKYFIDHMKFPDSFESRPVCFVGLGGIFGGLRPVEHLQQVFGYRNSYIFPQRVFLINVHKIFVNNEITDPLVKDLVNQQTKTFVKFVGALKTAGLTATSKK